MKSYFTIFIVVMLFSSSLSAQNLFEIASQSSDYNFDQITATNDSAALDSFIMEKMNQ